MFVPMNCLNRLPVTLYGTRKLIPFEIKCLLVGSTSPKSILSQHFSKREHLRYGKVVTLDDLREIIDQNTMKEPLLTKDLGPVHSYRPSMKELNLSDFQLLGSYVNGSRLVVADILERCIAYFIRHDQLTLHDMNYLVNYLNDPEGSRKKIKEKLGSEDQEIVSTTQNYLDGLRHRATQTHLYSEQEITSFIGSLDGKPTLDSADLDEIKTISKDLTTDTPVSYEQADVASTLETTKQQIDINLEVMKTLLSNALLIVKQQFQLLVKPYTESNPVTDLTNEDYDFLVRQFMVNPLLDHSRPDELTQFFTGASQIKGSALKTAIQLVNDQFDTAKQDLDMVFRILRGEDQNVENTQREALSDRMDEIRSRIIQTQVAMFQYLGKHFLFSWKDLATLLCSPNGNRTRYLAAIQSLAENPKKITKPLRSETIKSLPEPVIGPSANPLSPLPTSRKSVVRSNPTPPTIPSMPVLNEKRKYSFQKTFDASPSRPKK
ncbi:hypothetical protein BLNAU_13639 [Blattamonas nauphoetae]|uniref:FHA domain-containing protein n=1 Tax=Blattamonas nauphoetae TaxID=2049346 RepID=A0ABQ9XJC0_9EUKA|nr:hypothetical protein BLNAU_13634 [Blattamonas nauphoetae]KAK2951482.1 hypothetical protein BLNAU_13639 [Blattamonas nauphoetae]